MYAVRPTAEPPPLCPPLAGEREADVAIRLALPASGDFLIRKLAEVGFALALVALASVAPAIDASALIAPTLIASASAAAAGTGGASFRRAR